MTSALLASSAGLTRGLARDRTGIIIALVVIIPLFLWIVHVKFDEFWEFAAGIATAAFMVFAFPRVPHSPVSCIVPASHCTQQQMDHQSVWIGGLVLLLPLIVLSIVRERRKGWFRKRRR